MIKFDVGVFTDCGGFRSVNEDSFLLCGRTMPEEKREGRYGLMTRARQFGVSAVFDGMGGAQYGELASAIGAETLVDAMENILNMGSVGVSAYVAAANAAVCAKARELSATMGSTLVLVSVSDDRAAVYNIGDSRAYLVRGGQMKQLTQDHTVAESLSSMGIAGGSSKSHQLTQHLGIPEDEMVIQAFSRGTFMLADGDKLLLCSDGITDGLTDEQILALLSRDEEVSAMSMSLVRAAEAGGSKDNMTAMVFAFYREDETAEKSRAQTGAAASPGGPAGARRTRLDGAEVNRKRVDSAEPEAPRSSRYKSAAPVAEFGTPSAYEAGEAAAVGKDRFALFWLLNAFLALLLGGILGIISRLI